MIVGIAMQEHNGVPSAPSVPVTTDNGEQNHATTTDEKDDEIDGAGDYAHVHESTAATTPPVESQMPPINGSNSVPQPPQQVFVSANAGMGIAGLETQFQSLGIRQETEEDSRLEAMSEQPSAAQAQNGESITTDDNDAEETEDDPVKLFVGQVPKAMNEEDIFPTFDSFGPLKDVAIIRDKHTGIHRGCAFVTFWSAADADRAIEALHDKYTFPGARRPAQVKPADPSSAPENKLFIGMLSRKAGEDEVRELFAPFGEIREIHMIRNADGSSKCAAFLRFVKREAAYQAIENLNGNLLMDGAARPLIVKFADTKHQRHQRQIRNSQRRGMMVHPMAGPGGYPFPPQVPMGMPGHPGAGPQYPMPPAQYGAGGYGPGAQHHHHPPPPHHPYMYPQYGPAPGYSYQGRQEMRPSNPRPREGPAGANLFVYHLPHDLTDADLATAFNPFGNVISAKVYVDKYTGESKGFGFVSYDSVMSAEGAIEQMNGFQIGNKRLKVQHKRVHGSNPEMHHHQQHRHLNHQQQQHDHSPQSPPDSEDGGPPPPLQLDP